MNHYTIRKAIFEDAIQIAQVQIASRKSSFIWLIDQTYLDALGSHKTKQKRINERKEKILSLTFLIYVAITPNNEIIWFVKWWSLREKTLPVDGEIHALYILEQYKRQWIWTNLLQAMVDKFHSLGYTSFGIWSLSANNEANSFYKKMWWKQHCKTFYKIGEKSYPLTWYVFSC